MNVRFHLNGRPVEAEVEAGQTLLEFLRDHGLFSVKRGCDHGECGACAVLLDDRAVNSCLLLMPLLEGHRVETLEGLGGEEKVRELQESFLDAGAVQCGYCTPGMLISLAALLRENPEPGEEEVRDALAGNLCRCTGYVKPVEAALKVAERGRQG